ncbi:MAG: flagellar motor switch protein FliM [Acidobacteria bacterium]|nr:flagellar motor switch protein FliM [Acidobacteriota bacterium]
MDFQQPVDRITTTQMKMLRTVHEDLVRRLAPSLSASLQCSASATLSQIVQRSYAEFLQSLSPSATVATLGLAPTEGCAVLELNPSLVFPMLEILLGGRGTFSTEIQRALTRVEQNLFEGLIRIILRDLKESWKNISPMDFSILAMEPLEQHRPIISPKEGVVLVTVEIVLSETVQGAMNIALPSLLLKRMRTSPEPRRSSADASQEQQERVFQLVRTAAMELDVQLQGPTVSLRDVLKLREGHVLALDYPLEGPVHGLLNHSSKFRGQVVSNGKKRAFLVDGFSAPD